MLFQVMYHVKWEYRYVMLHRRLPGFLCADCVECLGLVAVSVWEGGHLVLWGCQRFCLERWCGHCLAFRTNNTTETLCKQRDLIPDKVSSSGVYKLTCPDCQKAYVGQNGRQFYTHYKEHRSAFYHNSHTSNFAQHSRTMHTPLAPSTT